MAKVTKLVICTARHGTRWAHFRHSLLVLDCEDEAPEGPHPLGQEWSLAPGSVGTSLLQPAVCTLKLVVMGQGLELEQQLSPRAAESLAPTQAKRHKNQARGGRSQLLLPPSS